MRSTSTLFVGAALATLACTSERAPTGPDSLADRPPAPAASALASNTWTAKAPLPMPVPRSGVTAGVVPNSAGQSVAYVLGGVVDDGGTTFNILAYNVATNTWTTKDSRPYRAQYNGVGRIGNRLFFSGGFAYHGAGYSAELYAYDPVGDRLIRKRDMPKYTADGVTGVIGGKLYVIPGTCSGEGWPAPGYCEVARIRELYRYDPATNAWSKLARCPHFHKNGVGGVINAKFYVVGADGSTTVSDLDVYDPATNTWSTLAPLPAAGRVIGAALGNKLFVIVESASGRRAYSYDPGAKSWNTRAAPQRYHDVVVRVMLGGTQRLLAIGGVHDFVIPNDSELYTP